MSAPGGLAAFLLDEDMMGTMPLAKDENDTQGQCLHDLFLNMVREYPNNPCIEEDGKILTYTQVDKASTALACLLVDTLTSNSQQELWQIRDKACIAILLDKCSDVYIAMIAILKIGRAYVCIDPAHGLHSGQFIADDSESAILITRSLDHGQCPIKHKGHVILLDSDSIQQDLASRKDPELRASINALPWDLCYLMYTSGTTGALKGVEISHNAAVNFVMGEAEILQVHPTDRVLQGFCPCFARSVEEIWSLALSKGACLVVAGKSLMKSGPKLPVELHNMGITIWTTVPTLLRALVDQAQHLTKLRMLISGGETLTPEVVDVWGQGRELWNTYGHTETTAVCIAKQVVPGLKSVPLGKTLKGYSSHVLDPQNPNIILEQGQVGELVIRGRSLAKGYHNHAKGTVDPFLTHPKLGRVYRTGDLVVLDAEGVYMYKGQINAQVKIEGNQVELSAIEQHICEVKGVKGAVAAVVPKAVDLVPTLIAVIAAEPDLAAASSVPGFTNEFVQATLATIFKHISNPLPTFAIPTQFAFIPAIPILSNGKADRKGLQEQLDKGTLLLHQRSRSGLRIGLSESPLGSPLQNGLEQKVAGIWKDTLGVAKVGRTENFFDLGGHSVSAAKAVSQLRNLTELSRISLRDFYAMPTIDALCGWAIALSAKERSPLSRQSKTGREGGHPTDIEGDPHYRLCLFFQTLYILWMVLAFVAIPAYMLASALTYYWAQYIYQKGNEFYMVQDYFWDSVRFASAFAMCWFVTVVTYTIALKWLVLGEMKPGNYELWSLCYLRYWTVKTTAGLVPQWLIRGTPVMHWYATLMGARIGKNVYLGSHLVSFWNDLITIEDGASMCAESNIHPIGFTSGAMVWAPVQVRQRAILHPRAILTRGQILDEDCEALPLDPHKPFAILSEPKAGQLLRRENPGYAWYTLLWCTLWIFIYVILLGAVRLWAHTYIFLTVYDEYGFACMLLVLTIQVPVLFVSEILITAMLRWLILADMDTTTVPLDSFQYCRWWAWEIIETSLLTTFHSVYGTAYTSMFLGIFGIEIGTRCEISTIFGCNPNGLRLMEESFVGDHVCLGAPIVNEGILTSNPVCVNFRASVGTGAVIKTGGTIGAKALCGVLSYCPNMVPTGSAWLGAPPFALPTNPDLKKSKFAYTSLYAPTRGSKLLRAVFEMLKIFFPPITFAAICAIWMRQSLFPMLINVMVDYPDDETLPNAWRALWAYRSRPLVNLAGVFLVLLWALLFGVAAKWVMIGKVKARAVPLHSSFVWASRTIQGWEHYIMPLTRLLCGTPWLSWRYQALGATIGRRACIWSLHIAEPDLVAIGNNSFLGEGAHVQTSLFEDRVLMLNHLRILNNVNIGNGAVVLPGSLLEDGANLGDGSLCCKGEVLNARASYSGSPAGPI